MNGAKGKERGEGESNDPKRTPARCRRPISRDPEVGEDKSDDQAIAVGVKLVIDMLESNGAMVKEATGEVNPGEGPDDGHDREEDPESSAKAT